MNNDRKYAAFGLLGISAVIVGSLPFALVSDGSGDQSGRVFLGGSGAGFFLSGIGVIIAAVWAYLTKSD